MVKKKEKNNSKNKTSEQNRLSVDEEKELLKAQLARTLADYDNLQKRVEREKEVFLKFANQALIERLLPIIDMLEQAQKHINDSGLAIAISEFKGLLNEEDVEEIKVEKGMDFDQERYEAVDSIEAHDKSDEGKVAEMLISGYKFKEGSLIRPVKVKVYRKN